MNSHIILADNQDITRAGILYVCSQADQWSTDSAEDKCGLIELLKNDSEAVVVMDYTLFDVNDVDELEILHLRFPDVQWVMFSTDLSGDFVRRLLALSPRFSILLKESPLQEVRECLSAACRHQRYICQRMAEIVHQQSAARCVRGAGILPQETKAGAGKRLLHAFPEDRKVGGIHADADDVQRLCLGALTEIPVHRRGLSIAHGRDHRGHRAAGDGTQALLKALGYVNGVQVPFRFRHGMALQCALTEFYF